MGCSLQSLAITAHPTGNPVWPETVPCEGAVPLPRPAGKSAPGDPHPPNPRAYAIRVTQIHAIALQAPRAVFDYNISPCIRLQQ